MDHKKSFKTANDAIANEAFEREVAIKKAILKDLKSFRVATEKALEHHETPDYKVYNREGETVLEGYTKGRLHNIKQQEKEIKVIEAIEAGLEDGTWKEVAESEECRMTGAAATALQAERTAVYDGNHGRHKIGRW